MIGRVTILATILGILACAPLSAESSVSAGSSKLVQQIDMVGLSVFAHAPAPNVGASDVVVAPFLTWYRERFLTLTETSDASAKALINTLRSDGIHLSGTARMVRGGSDYNGQAAVIARDELGIETIWEPHSIPVNSLAGTLHRR